MRHVALMVLAVASQMLFAFPEMTRFGYNNCTACHVAPTGAGLLTSYGRSLSAEVLSTFGTEKDAGVLWAATDREALENWLLLGGNVRAVQVKHEDANHKSARWVNMQADVQAGLVRERWATVISVGQLDQNSKWMPYSSEFYGMWRPKDELTFRAGRFVPAYGLHIPDHTAFMRSFLGFGLNGARDSAEAQWTGESLTFNFTHSKEFDTDDPEVANTVQAQIFFWERFKVAANYWVGSTHAYTRNLAGLWSVLGFTKKFFLVSEVDLQNQRQNGQGVQSFVSYNKLGYTIYKGVDVFLLSEHLHTDTSLHNTITNRNGPGVQFYPVPHLEFVGAWTKQKAEAPGAREEDYAWLLLHYYL